MRRPAQITTCSRVAPCCRSASPTRRGGVEVMHDLRLKPPRAERLHERRDIKAKLVGKFMLDGWRPAVGRAALAFRVRLVARSADSALGAR